MKKLVMLISVLIVIDLIFLAGFLEVYAGGSNEVEVNRPGSEKISGISITSSDVKYTGGPGDSFPNAKEVHWNHMPLSYNFNDCSEKEVERVQKAFSEIEQRTYKEVYFLKGENPDIVIVCYDYAPLGDGESKTIGEANYHAMGQIISSAQIDFYEQFTQTNYPFVEVHEILHVLGIEHKQEKSSVMYPETTYFDNYEADFGEPRIDSDIVEKLIITYNR